MTRRAITLILGLALVAAACGDDETSDTTVPIATTTIAPATTTTTAPVTTTTEAPTTTTTVAEAGGIVPGEDPEVDAVVSAYTIALDSVSSYEEKVVFIDDPTGLEDTIAQYLATASSIGGVGVGVSAVAIDGDAAEVTYDLLIGGNPTYPDLKGAAVKATDGWKITRDAFCFVMVSARGSCP